METETLAAAGEIDFSLLALFLRATLTVKIVMVILIISSIWSWAIIFQKHLNFRRARQSADNFEDAFWSGQPLDEVYEEMADDPEPGSERIGQGDNKCAKYAPGQSASHSGQVAMSVD